MVMVVHGMAVSTNWRPPPPSGLLFSDAPEITGLANLPLGLAVGPVYQPIDTSWLGCSLI